MGLDGADLLDDGDGAGGGGKAVSTTSVSDTAVSCSVCFEAVVDNGDRSWAKLQCGHQFHLDCIGSAFNAKGAMQCPNCRKIEKGQWLYANGNRSVPEFNMDDWTPEDDLYDLASFEMSYGLTAHWCPYNGITARLPSSFEEGEFLPSAYHEIVGQHPIFSEQTGITSGGHPCPYIAYVGPIHPSSSNSSGSVTSDLSNYPPNHWNAPPPPSLSNEIQPTSYAFPGVDLHYHTWDQHQHHSAPFPTSNTRSDQPPSITSMPPQRTRPTSSDLARSGGGASYMNPFLVGHSSGARAGSSVASSMIPPYPGSVARARDRVQALQAYFQQPSNSQPPPPPPQQRPPPPQARRSTSHRGGVGLSQVGPVASSSDQNGGFYFFPSSGSSGVRNFQEAENPVVANRYHVWEREHTGLPSFIPNQVDRDSVWGPFHQPGGSERSTTSFRQRHGNGNGNGGGSNGSERMPSQNRS